MALQIEKIKYAGSSKIISALCTKINAVIDAAGSGGGGGSTVIVDPILQSGTKIAEIEVDDTTKEIYAPTPPSALSDLSDDATHRLVSDSEKSTWNNKSDFSGDYSDLTNAPTIPTKVSDLVNDSGFIDNTVNNLTNYYSKSQTYTQSEVDALISAIVTLNVLVVQTLPTQDISTTTIYLVPKQTTGTNDVYDEYIYINNAWERIGDTTIDLSNYYTKSQVDSLLADKVNVLDYPFTIINGELCIVYDNGL
jgi:hypothetical protein